jgi:surface polysaccharide O-acyltransferase-like enzyme
MKERKIYLDLIRVIACALVIIIHSPIPATINPVAQNHGPFLMLVSYLTAPCVPLFLMLSGALLLPCKADISAYDYLKKRLNRVVGPTLCFSILYVLWFGFPSSIKDVVIRILSVPFSPQGHGVLKFMYILTGLYLLIPILSHWLRSVSRRELEMYLCLWVITLFYPFIGLFIGIDTSDSGILYYFTGYVGYFILGHYLSKYDIPLWIVLSCIVLVLPLPLLNKVFNWNLNFYSAFWYLSITVAIMTAAWFVVIKKYWGNLTSLNGYWGKFVESTSNFSFGIYLVHIFFMRAFIWYLPFVQSIPNYYIQTLVVFILTFAASWLFSWIVAKLPYSKYIIGYSSKK